MDKDYLLLKRAALSRSSGQRSDDDFDVLADGAVVGRIVKANDSRPSVALESYLFWPAALAAASCNERKRTKSLVWREPCSIIP
jgi:hypothetical protein